MTQRRSCILTYHSLDRTGSVISLSPDRFREQMKWLAESGTPVVPLSEIQKTPGGLALTFDDGFRNFYEQALPVLVRYHFPATVFVVAAHCGGWNGWQQPLKTIPRLELMNWSELEAIAAAGVTLGGHTATHPYMSLLSREVIDRELKVCRAAIEDRTGRPVDTFAYPYGDVTAAVRDCVGQHFRLACGTRLAFVSPASDVLDLPRIDTFYLQSCRWFESLGRASGSVYIAARRWMRQFRPATVLPQLERA